MRELFFIILAWGRLKTDTKPRTYKRKMLATLTTQNFIFALQNRYQRQSQR